MILRRLHILHIISEKQWKNLYPKHRDKVSSQQYDRVLLVILLKNICHLSPPYPNGWDGSPDPGDLGMSADLVRLNACRKVLYGLNSVNEEQFELYIQLIWQPLVRLGGEMSENR